MTVREAAAVLERIDGELEGLAKRKAALEDEKLQLEANAGQLYSDSLSNPAKAGDWKRLESRLGDVQVEIVRVQQAAAIRERARDEQRRQHAELTIRECEAEYAAAVTAMEPALAEIVRVMGKAKAAYDQVMAARARCETAETRADRAQHTLGVPQGQRKRFALKAEAELVDRFLTSVPGVSPLWDPKNIGVFDFAEFLRIFAYVVKSGQVKL